MKTIHLTDEQYKVLQDMLLEQGFKLCEETKAELEKWQPKKHSYFIDDYGHIRHYKKEELAGHDRPSRAFGMCYPTLEAAENARDAMRNHNRLLAWLAENDDGWVADWSDSEQGKFCVYSGHDSKEGVGYDFSVNWSCKDLAKVYMSKENAIKLCKLLNEGIVEL